MAQQNNKANEKKKGGFGAAFGALSGVIDDIVNEVKQDLKEMTPVQASAADKRKAELANQSNKLQNVVSSATYGLSENTVSGGDESPQSSPTTQPVSAPQTNAAFGGLPTGNLWHHLTNPTHATTLRADACYHALTAADVESYARAISNEGKPPFTLGIVAVNISAMTEEEITGPEGFTPDLLTETLLKTLNAEPRLFGAMGAGPRQLWPNLQLLDDFMVKLLNTQRKIIAIGPLGLDEPFAPYSIPQQQAQLQLQLEIAADFNIPVLLTTRKSQAKLAETLQAVQTKTGTLPPLIYLDALLTPEDFALVQKFGMYALLRPEITAPDFAGKPFYRDMPAGKLLIASGSALVAPHGFAGHFNQPKFLENSLQAAAKIRGSNPAVLGPTTSGNLVSLFGIA